MRHLTISFYCTISGLTICGGKMYTFRARKANYDYPIRSVDKPIVTREIMIHYSCIWLWQQEKQAKPEIYKLKKLLESPLAIHYSVFLLKFYKIKEKSWGNSNEIFKSKNLRSVCVCETNSLNSRPGKERSEYSMNIRVEISTYVTLFISP